MNLFASFILRALSVLIKDALLDATQNTSHWSTTVNNEVRIMKRPPTEFYRRSIGHFIPCTTCARGGSMFFCDWKSYVFLFHVKRIFISVHRESKKSHTSQVVMAGLKSSHCAMEQCCWLLSCLSRWKEAWIVGTRVMYFSSGSHNKGKCLSVCWCGPLIMCVMNIDNGVWKSIKFCQGSPTALKVENVCVIMEVYVGKGSHKGNCRGEGWGLIFICCWLAEAVATKQSLVLASQETPFGFTFANDTFTSICRRWFAAASPSWWCSTASWPTATGCWWKVSTSTTSWSSPCLPRGTTSKSTCALAGVSWPVACACVCVSV